MGAEEKIRKSMDDPLVQAALSDGHRIVMGPGEPALSEWAAAGLSLPNLEEFIESIEISALPKLIPI